MKNKFTKILLTLCMMTIVFSVMSMNVNAEKIKKEETSNYELRVDVEPNRIYINNHVVRSSGLPSRKHFYDEERNGVYYSGWLTLVSYQNTGDGYLALYSGYIHR